MTNNRNFQDMGGLHECIKQGIINIRSSIKTVALQYYFIR